MSTTYGSARAVIRARERFLATGQVPSGVRPATARSWMRSHAHGLSPDDPIELRYAGAVDGENALLRAARPVAERLFADLRDVEIAMVMTDADARVLARWTGRADLAAELDAFGAAPGFVFEESRAGTSALGSVLEEGGPVEVIASEHYLERLQLLSAVGMPVVHPVTRRIEGVVDLVSPSERHSRLMRPLIARIASEIGGRLLTGYAGQDRVLLDTFLHADRRGPRRAMLAINGRLLMANPQASDLLGEASHALLWEQVQRALAEGRRTFAALSDRVHGAVDAEVVEVRDAGQRVGAVLQLRVREQPAEPGTPTARPSHVPWRLHERLPGASAFWREVLERSAAVFAAGERLLLVGESGVGKRALATALCAVRDPQAPIVEHDALDAGDDRAAAWLERVTAPLDRRAAACVLTHLDRLDPETTERLCRWLDALPPGAPPVVGTMCAAQGRSLPPSLLSQFPHVVALPPLRARPEDIPEIAAAVAREPAVQAPVRVDPGAVRLLAADTWPGNVRQLRRVVLAARAACPGTVIRPDDLPELLRAPRSHLPLTTLQRLERETIMATLAAHGGNKLAAAASLGISRSTLYRKLHVLQLER